MIPQLCGSFFMHSLLIPSLLCGVYGSSFLCLHCLISQMKFFNSYATLKMYFAGGALDCSSLHVGQINPGALRGNHRHHTCNETFLISGAETKFRVRLCNTYYCFYLPSITLNSNFCWYPKCRPRRQGYIINLKK